MNPEANPVSRKIRLPRSGYNANFAISSKPMNSRTLILNDPQYPKRYNRDTAIPYGTAKAKYFL
jgi:hypothetical protein